MLDIESLSASKCTGTKASQVQMFRGRSSRRGCLEFVNVPRSGRVTNSYHAAAHSGAKRLLRPLRCGALRALAARPSGALPPEMPTAQTRRQLQAPTPRCEARWS